MMTKNSDTQVKIINAIGRKFAEELLNSANSEEGATMESMKASARAYKNFIKGVKAVLVTDEIHDLKQLMDKKALTITDLRFYMRLEKHEIYGAYKELVQKYA